MSNAKNPAVNTPKAGYSDSTSSTPTPGAFRVNKFIMTNSKGVSKDLKALNLVDSFTITSELFSPVVTLTATIRDNEDFIDGFDICGQETIRIEIDPVNKGDAIKQTFFVKEYVNYTKTLDFPNTQIYSFVAISEFAYRSSLMNICRVVDKEKTVAQNIETIFKGDLGLKEFVVDGDVSAKFEGIINIQRPLKAAEWLRSRCFEEDGSPFFLHSDVTQEGKVYLSSWKSLNTKAVLYKAPNSRFKYRQQSEKTPGTAEHTKEERSRILSMMSNIKFDRLASANAGAYASRLNVTDYAAKAYYTLDFKTKETKDWKPQKYIIRNREGAIEEDATMHKIPSASIASVQINTAINPDGKANSITTAHSNIPPGNAFIARLNEINHEIVVYGDSALNPGVKIDLEVPKALRNRTGYEKDPVVSGTFMIVVAAHIFSNGIYTNKLKLVRLGGVEAVSGSDGTYTPSTTVEPEVASSSPENNPSPTGSGADVPNSNTNSSPVVGDTTDADTKAALQGLGLFGPPPPETATPIPSGPQT
jgi:hypothetical protein